MRELMTTSKLVKTILEQDKQARNSDSFLYFKVLEYYGNKKGIDIHGMSIPAFLLNMSAWGFPPFESVRRSRQMLQAKHPELAANDKVEAWRDAKEMEYRAFVNEMSH